MSSGNSSKKSNNQMKTSVCVWVCAYIRTLRIGHIKLDKEEKKAKNVDGLGGGGGGIVDLPSLQSCHHLFSS